MNEEQAKALREPFPDAEIGKLPRVTCGDCRKAQGKVCSKHTKSKCQVCGNYITSAHMHLDYVGHAELTDRLLSVDPMWSWEPASWSDAGEPVITKHGTNLVMWGRLTLCGVTRLGVGTAPSDKDDVHKELIGDFLRNAAMRFGVALDLWRKSERAEVEADAEQDHVDDTTCISPENAEALRARCEEKGVSVSEVVMRATDGRTGDPAEVLRSEIGATKKAMDDLGATLARAAS
jgi:ribosomal protein S27E